MRRCWSVKNLTPEPAEVDWQVTRQGPTGQASLVLTMLIMKNLGATLTARDAIGAWTLAATANWLVASSADAAAKEKRIFQRFYGFGAGQGGIPDAEGGMPVSTKTRRGRTAQSRQQDNTQADRQVGQEAGGG